MCRSRAALESTWLTWAVHRRSEVRRRDVFVFSPSLIRVLPLRLIAKSEEKGRLVNSTDTVLSTLTANQSESHADVASTGPTSAGGLRILWVIGYNSCQGGVVCKLVAACGNCHAVRQVNR